MRLVDAGGKICDFDQLALGEHDGMLDAVFQFAHIARPGVIKEQPQGLRAEIVDALSLG